MYNRYIPQSDGSYRRRFVSEQSRREPQPIPTPPVQEHCQEEPDCAACPHRKPPRREPSREQFAGSFLKNLLPRQLDTEDLLIVVLLLLMTGEGPEDRSLPLLTLALYLLL